MIKTKPFSIPKDIVQRAYQRVKYNRGSAGIDGMSLERFEEGRREHLYRLWNRMSSGSYMPSPVKLVEIPKQGGGKRLLGSSCVGYISGSDIKPIGCCAEFVIVIKSLVSFLPDRR